MTTAFDLSHKRVLAVCPLEEVKHPHNTPRPYGGQCSLHIIYTENAWSDRLGAVLSALRRARFDGIHVFGSNHINDCWRTLVTVGDEVGLPFFDSTIRASEAYCFIHWHVRVTNLQSL